MRHSGNAKKAGGSLRKVLGMQPWAQVLCSCATFLRSLAPLQAGVARWARSPRQVLGSLLLPLQPLGWDKCCGAVGQAGPAQPSTGGKRFLAESKMAAAQTPDLCPERIVRCPCPPHCRLHSNSCVSGLPGPTHTAPPPLGHRWPATLWLPQNAQALRGRVRVAPETRQTAPRKCMGTPLCQSA